MAKAVQNDVIMRKLAAVIFISTALFACKNKSKVAAVTPVAPTMASASTKPVASTAPKEVDSLLISYAQTPCFGTCPVYEIKVYRSGFTTYEGRQNTEYKGMNYTWLSKDQVKGIIQSAREAGFFTLKSEYDNNISDLSFHITYVKDKGEALKVTNKGGEIPEALKDTENIMRSTFKEIAWKPLESKK